MRVVASPVLISAVVFALARASALSSNAAPCDSPLEELPRLSDVTPHAGRLARGDAICFSLTLESGELARIAIEAEAGYVRARVLGPSRNELQVTWTSAFATAAPSPRLAIEAPERGTYIVELSVPTWVSFTNAQSFRVHVSSRESPSVRATRREQLSRDARVAWLRAHAQRIRTLDPGDADFSDLQFLRDVLRDSRVVLLGEGDNGGGSDVLAKTRLVKFLHDELGFDVIVFPTALHSTAAAWRALQTDMDPRAALQQAGSPLLLQSAQAEPLIQYLAARARSRRPIEVAGFDSQLTGSGAASLLVELRRLLIDRPAHRAIVDTSALPGRVLAGVLDGGFAQRRMPLPSNPEQAETVEALRSAARSLQHPAADRQSLFWAQVLTSTAAQVDLLLANLRRPDAKAYVAGLVRQMAENLVWLLQTHYPDRKVIVWTHTFHAMRAPEITSHGRSAGYTVGEAVWEAVGEESFSIGLTSYDGTSHWITQPDDYYQSVIPHQQPGDGFEALMVAAGHDMAFVNLRDARARNEWSGSRFIASALYLVPEEAEWSKALDALLFIRTQQPRQKAR